MYGSVNKAIEELVCSNYGEERWEAIRAAAGCDVEMFIGTESYPDELTYQLVGAASQVLGVGPEAVLRAFGRYWIIHTAREGFGDLLLASGASLPEFLRNLPNFHARLTLIFPDLRPPSFSCSE